MKKWLSVLLITGLFSVAFGQAWSIVKVDATGDVGRFSSMVIENGLIHIAYFDNTTVGAVKFAVSDDGGKTGVIEVVDDNSGLGGVGFFTAIDVGPNGEAQVVYYDMANTHLKWARRGNPDQWFVGTPDGDDVNDVGQGCDIAVDDDNNAHISYYNATTGLLMYARPLTSGWATDTVDSVGPLPIFVTDIKGTSMTLDPSGVPHIAYYAWDVVGLAGYLKHAYQVSGNWIIDTVAYVAAVDFGRWPDIIIREDGGNFPYVSHFDLTNGQFKYERWTGSAWAHDIIDNSPGVGMYGTQQLGPLTTHVSYFDPLNGDLKWGFTEDYLGWHTESIDTLGNVGLYTSIDLTHRGELDFPHISYYDADSLDLKFATFLIKDVLPTNWYFDGYPPDMRQINPDSAYTPVVTVRNLGNTPATFEVEFLIRYSGFPDYLDTALVGPLGENEETSVTLDTWSKDKYEDSWYYVYVYTKLADDSLPHNDTIFDSLFCTPVGIAEEPVAPKRFELTAISSQLRLSIPVNVTGEVYVVDVAGRRRLTLDEGIFEAGTYDYDFAASELPSGVYFVRFRSSAITLTRKSILIR